MTVRQAFVLGVTGGFGASATLELMSRGWHVRALVRNAARARDMLEGGLQGEGSFELIEGDAEDAAAIPRALGDSSLVVHALSYPYHLWNPGMRIATERIATIAAEKRLKLLFPGNVYVLGEQNGRTLDEDADFAPCSSKGALRVDLERVLAASAERGAGVLILRSGDFFGPTVRNLIVDQILAAAAAGEAPKLLGDPAIDHEWVYMPDLTRAAVDLIEAGLPAAGCCETVHFPGYMFSPAGDFARQAAEAGGVPGGAWETLPFSLIEQLAAIDPAAEALLEMRYLWEGTVALSSRRFRQLLPGFQPTPITDAIRRTLTSYRAERGDAE